MVRGDSYENFSTQVIHENFQIYGIFGSNTTIKEIYGSLAFKANVSVSCGLLTYNTIAAGQLLY